MSIYYTDHDYIYVTMGQMVTPSRGKAKLRMVSPYFEATTFNQPLTSNGKLPSTRCFSFWYRSASFKRSVPASFTFGLQSGVDFFSKEIDSENANVWRFKQIDLMFKRPTDQIRLVIDGGDTYFSYIAFDHFHLSQQSCEDSQHVVDKYRNLGGNCPGAYLTQFGEPIGCFKCSLAECLQTCDAFTHCQGVSWVDRRELNEAFPKNSQCYLKYEGCWPNIVKHQGGYKFYERIAGAPRLNKTIVEQKSDFEPIPAPTLDPHSFMSTSSSEMYKWLPRNAKEQTDDVQHFVDKKIKMAVVENNKFFPLPTYTNTIPMFSFSSSPLIKSSSSIFETSFPTKSEIVTVTEATRPRTTTRTTTTTTTTTTTKPTTVRTTPLPTTVTDGTTTTSGYSLVPSPFPNSKHVFGYTPLQPFGNCGGHFIIDENHQYLGCTRCSFAQCATLCSLSDQCRGFSFTESTLVAKQCYLKTAMTCEPQPSSTGFKYFIKIRKTQNQKHGVVASNGKNGIGAFTIRPVMPKQTKSSEQESKESTRRSSYDDLGVTPSWYHQVEASDWTVQTKYVALNGNCAGSFLRDQRGEAVSCPRCSLAACQKLCDQDDECRGISFSNDPHVAVQCYLKTIGSCSPLSESSGYYFHTKRD